MYERRHAARDDQLRHADRIALPDLDGQALHTSLLTLVWVILVYAVTSTQRSMLSAGRLSDQFGR